MPRTDQTITASSAFDHRRLARNPIAIVGMSGLLPMASNHREYWQNIFTGVDCTAEVPESRWRLDDYYAADPETPDKTYARRGAFVPDVDFNPIEFGLPPNQLGVTSTMQLLSLGVARDLLIDAGATGSDWYDPVRTGVVLGITGAVPLTHQVAARTSTPVLEEVARSCGLSEEAAADIAGKFVKAFAPWEENTFPGLLMNVVAGRVANRLGLGGMNCTVDAACAASLAATRTAIAELVDGRADTMITGGVDTETSIFMYMCFSKVGALSHSDRISPLSNAADGTMLGEGLGMVALRRLADAERDGNRIYAVIRGIGSSSDGRANSIYAPLAAGQRIALDRAYADAECEPSSVELFELHATGTAVGDRTELSALGEALADADERHVAALGSVKSQIGHTKGTAGTAGMMKVALALHQKVLPGTINVEEPSSSIDFIDAPYYINTQTRPWILDPKRPHRRAAVSAMGFGGTNFHVVLEEHTSDRTGLRMLHRAPTAQLWHAPDAAQLLELLRAGAPSVDGDIPADHARVGFVASDDEQAETLRELAIEQLATAGEQDEWSHPRGVFYRRRALENPRVGALFAGQGSQYLNMGLEAALNNPLVGRAFDTANAALADAEPRLSQVVFPPPVFDATLRKTQEANLLRTEYTQPSIGALSAGQFGYLSELGLTCSAFSGHSFGELTALWAAGSLSETDFFRLASARGRAMAPAAGVEAGTMAAIQTNRERVAELLGGFPDVVICNHNTPAQVVVGGSTDDIARLVEECREHKIKARPLPVAAAFHTRFVAHAVDSFRPAVAAVRIGEPSAPVYANSPGASYGADVEANARTLVQQLLEPVEFVEGLTKMRADGVTVFVEFGPKQVLTQFVRQTLGEDVYAISTDGGPLNDSDVALKRAAVRLAVLGVALSGINRFAEPQLEAVVSKGMSVTISAPEYVPESRRAAYEAAVAEPPLAELVRAATPTAVPEPVAVPAPAVVAAPAVAPAAVTAPAPAVVVRPEAPAPDPITIMTIPSARIMEDDVSSPIDQYLTLHNQYLDGQLRVAEQVAEVLRQPGGAGVADTVAAIARQSEAIGRAHARASEILAELAALEAGTVVGPVAAVRYQEPAPVWVSPSTPAVGSAVRSESAGAALPAARHSAPAVEQAPRPVTTLARPAEPVRPAVVAANGAEPAAAVAEPAAVAVGGVDAAALNGSLLAVIAEKTGYPVEMIDPSMDLESDLGIDSIKRVQVLAALRERVPGLPAAGTEQLGELRTIDQLVAFLSEAGGVHPKARDAEAMTPRHTVELTRLPAVDVIEAPYRTDPTAVLIDDGRSDADALAAGLTSRGWTVRRARHGADAGELFTGTVDLYVLMYGEAPDWDGARRYLTEAIMVAKQAATAQAPEQGRVGFVSVTRLDGGLGLHGSRGAVPSLIGGVGGVVKTLAAERQSLFCRAIDVDPEVSDADFAPLVLDEIHDAAVDTAEVGIDDSGARWTVLPGGYRQARHVVAIGERPAAEDVELTDQDVLLVTGGARGVTAECVRALAGCTQARFLLLGRSELAPEPDWAAGVPEADLWQATIAGLSASGARPTPQEVRRLHGGVVAGREIRNMLDALGERGTYLAADITDAAAVEAVLADYRGVITGVVHGAGVLADSSLDKKTVEQIDKVLAPKLSGLHNVLNAIDAEALRHIILFTSVAGLLGNPGQADYAAANEALCRFAAGWKHAHPATRATAIDWAAWDGGMVTAELRELFESKNIPLLGVERGATAFVEQFTAPRADDICVLVGASSALGGLRTAPVPAFTAVRDIGGLTDDPVLQAHRVGSNIVFPATFGLGWLINVVERAYPDRMVVGATDFEVHKGIVFDGTQAREYHVHVDTGVERGGRIQVRAAVRGKAENGRVIPHYAATLALAAAPGTPAVFEVPPLVDGPADALEIYREATLFHGPPLQGLHSVLDHSAEHAVVKCRLADANVADGAYHGQLHTPVIADLLLQGAAMLGKELSQSAALPLGIGRAEWFAPLPDDEPFILLVDDVRKQAATIMVSATAVDASGRVLLQFNDIVLVSTKDMTEMFRESVRHWLPAGNLQKVKQ